MIKVFVNWKLRDTFETLDLADPKDYGPICKKYLWAMDICVDEHPDDMQIMCLNRGITLQSY